jgi:DNA-binding NarL/FixJ family response regulator
MATKILAADAQELFLRGLCAVLESQSGWEVTQAKNGREALELAESLQPDVVILDIRLPEVDGLEVTRRIRRLVPRAEIMLIGRSGSEQMVATALQAGARGYLARSTAARDVIDAVSALARHKPFLNPEISEFLLKEYLKTTTLHDKQTLTARERQVLQLLAQGKTNKEIAATTGTSPKTIETQRARLMRKVKVGSVAELVRYAIRNEIIEA